MSKDKEVEALTATVTRIVREHGEQAAASLLLMQLRRIQLPHPRVDSGAAKILFGFDWILGKEDTDADFTLSKHLKIPISTVRNVLNKHRPDWKSEQPPRRKFKFADLKEFQ